MRKQAHMHTRQPASELCGMPLPGVQSPHLFANQYKGWPTPVGWHPHAPRLCHAPVQAVFLCNVHSMGSCTATASNSMPARSRMSGDVQLGQVQAALFATMVSLVAVKATEQLAAWYSTRDRRDRTLVRHTTVLQTHRTPLMTCTSSATAGARLCTLPGLSRPHTLHGGQVAVGCAEPQRLCRLLQRP
jgi:hypothetical protein